MTHRYCILHADDLPSLRSLLRGSRGPAQKGNSANDGQAELVVEIRRPGPFSILREWFPGGPTRPEHGARS